MRAHCSSRNCTSGKPALWEPVLLLWPDVKNSKMWQPVSANIIGIVICDDCTKTVQPSDFVPTLAAWMKICNAVMAHGKVRPTMIGAKLSFVVPETHHLPSETVFT